MWGPQLLYGGQRTIHRSQFASYLGSPRPQLVRLGSKRLCLMRQLTPILSLTRVVACLNMGALGGWGEGEGEGRGSHRQLTSRLITEVLLSSLELRAAQLTLLERIFSEVSRRTSDPCSNIVLSLGFFFGGGDILILWISLPISLSPAGVVSAILWLNMFTKVYRRKGQVLVKMHAIRTKGRQFENSSDQRDLSPTTALCVSKSGMFTYEAQNV